MASSNCFPGAARSRARAPTTASAPAMYDTSNPLGYNEHVQSPKG
ncbi:hypothetical protein [Paenarthrobacter sp. YIM B13468]